MIARVLCVWKNTGYYTRYDLRVVYHLYLFYFKLSCVYCSSCLVCIVVVVLCVLL